MVFSHKNPANKPFCCENFNIRAPGMKFWSILAQFTLAILSRYFPSNEISLKYCVYRKKQYRSWVLMTRRPWCQQGFGQSTAGAECGPPDLPEGGSECYVHCQEPIQWVRFSLYASPVNYFSQSSTPRRLGWMTAPKLATSSRSVSAASASAAWDAATGATANLQMSELMLLLPGNCCPTFRQNTCKCQSFVSTNLCLAK